MTTRFQIPTALGPVWFWGRDTGRPILLVISGAFAASDFFHRIQERFPAADVLRTHLPGNHCPELSEISIPAYVASLDEAMVSMWPSRPVLAFGVSTGGLVALGLRRTNVRRLVVIEPPILTEGVWPLRLFRDQAPPEGRTFVWNVFGVGDNRLEARDHGWILEGLHKPTLAMIGDDPLLPLRNFTRMPSLISADTLNLLRGHPAIEIEIALGAGHNIPRDAGQQMHEAVVRTWNAAFPEAPVVA